MLEKGDAFIRFSPSFCHPPLSLLEAFQRMGSRHCARDPWGSLWIPSCFSHGKTKLQKGPVEAGAVHLHS